MVSEFVIVGGAGLLLTGQRSDRSDVMLSVSVSGQHMDSLSVSVGTPAPIPIAQEGSKLPPAPH